MKSFCSPVLGISFGNGNGVLFLGQQLTIQTRCFSFRRRSRGGGDFDHEPWTTSWSHSFLASREAAFICLQGLLNPRISPLISKYGCPGYTIHMGQTRHIWPFWNLLSGLLCFDILVNSELGWTWISWSTEHRHDDDWTLTLQFEIAACLARMSATDGKLCPLYGRRGGIARLAQSSHVISNDLMTTTLHPE